MILGVVKFGFRYGIAWQDELKGSEDLFYTGRYSIYTHKNIGKRLGGSQ